MLRAILFDFDGTLADSKEAFLSAYNELADRHHFQKMTLARFDSLKSLSMKERCAALGISFYRIPFLVGELSKLYQKSLQRIPLMDGVGEMLQELSGSGYTLAILSSNEEKNIHSLLEMHGLNYFSTVMCSKKLFAKDRLMHRYLKRNQLTADQVVYIGDEERDILASRKCGIRVIWAAWGFDGIENIRKAGPNFIADCPADLLRIVRELS
ncbi:HAD-IA family hydrolase [Sporolactobacillus shoreicorticis]|uniref:HAD-IA family hydrolase n=1 Tax=Sporolactobacillus shoreicorticis TaxID=1923877 RepID=A0ABW5S3S2_9BACL|nr:HAD-IA family hydrolase [Sporolactobacillus shoreicorticis]MCO7124322.1 HAD-IA family hydrolase [Sporolactobacillus shoreicorticis]